MSFIQYIWQKKFHRSIILGIVIINVIVIIFKITVWSTVSLEPFIFFGITIPLLIAWINLFGYKFNQEWNNIIKYYGQQALLRSNVRVYIKNYWWPKLIGPANTVNVDRMNIPFYDFYLADLLESEEFIIIRGKGPQYLGLLNETVKPFIVYLKTPEVIDKKIYQVQFQQMNESKEFKEVTFIDRHLGENYPVTIKIYK